MINLNDKNRISITITVFVIILIMIIGFTAQQREEISVVERGLGRVFLPAQRFVTRTASALEESLVILIRSSEMKEEKNLLRLEIETMQQEMVKQVLTGEELLELRALRDTLNSIQRFIDPNPITANVVAKTPSNWFEMFTIDAGTSHGIGKNSVVIGPGGLIGRVYESGGNWAKVITIIDNSSSVSFQILRDGTYQGIVSGSVTNELSGYLFDPNAEVVVGDLLITTGIGLYPRGILIGKVTEVGRTSDSLLKSVVVEPAVNFKRLDKVLVINPRAMEE